MVVIDKRNGDSEKNARLEKETKSHDRCGLHKVDREAQSSSKTSANIEGLWLAPPSPPSLPPPSDPEENSRDDPFQTDLKKYHFSGTVQDGNKGYFVGWYINQKTKREELGKMKIINVDQTQPTSPKPMANVTKEEDAIVSRSKDTLGYYPQPLQTPYITNAMNPLPTQ